MLLFGPPLTIVELTYKWLQIYGQFQTVVVLRISSKKQQTSLHFGSQVQVQAPRPVPSLAGQRPRFRGRRWHCVPLLLPAQETQETVRNPKEITEPFLGMVLYIYICIYIYVCVFCFLIPATDLMIMGMKNMFFFFFLFFFGWPPWTGDADEKTVMTLMTQQKLLNATACTTYSSRNGQPVGPLEQHLHPLISQKRSDVGMADKYGAPFCNAWRLSNTICTPHHFCGFIGARWASKDQEQKGPFKRTSGHEKSRSLDLRIGWRETWSTKSYIFWGHLRCFC